MLVPPATLSDSDVLDVVRKHWCSGVDQVEYLAVGFGAHHWRATADRTPLLFVTLDTPDGVLFPSSFEQAYATAAQLADAGFSHGVPPLRAATGSFTVPCADGLASACAWTDGTTPSEEEAAATPHVRAVLDVLRALHALTPPDTAPVWSPRIGRGATERLTTMLAEPWDRGPQGEDARGLIRSRLAAITEWESRYATLADVAAERRAQWVLTHGEPHHANQIVTDEGILLVDWESCVVAPAERDLRDLPAAFQSEAGADTEMLELFELEWRLSEVQEYALWFRSPHQGDQDDVIAFEGLVEELSA